MYQNPCVVCEYSDRPMCDSKVCTEFPHRLLPLSKKQNQRVKEDFEGLPSGLQVVLPWRFKLSGTASETDIRRFYHQIPRANDVWLCSPPKCGSMWCQELVWLVKRDLDYTSCRQMLTDRWSYRESHLSFDKLQRVKLIKDDNNNTLDNNNNNNDNNTLDNNNNTDNTTEIAAKTNQVENDSNRGAFIKSHMPFSLCPPTLLDTCKTFYIARNPKDICVSFYRHARRYKLIGFNKDFDTFAEHFLAGTVISTPVIPHMIEAWNLRHHPNLCFLFYENLKSSLVAEIHRVARFLDKNYSDSQIETLADYLRIDNFKKNPWRKHDFGNTSGIVNEGEGDFIRKGKTGDWKNYMSGELNERFDQWMDQNLQDTDLRFQMDLSYQD